MPGDVRPGDLVTVPGTGAYCRSMASNYNHALRPPVLAVRDGSTRVVLRREGKRGEQKGEECRKAAKHAAENDEGGARHPIFSGMNSSSS